MWTTPSVTIVRNCHAHACNCLHMLKVRNSEAEISNILKYPKGNGQFATDSHGRKRTSAFCRFVLCYGHGASDVAITSCIQVATGKDKKLYEQIYLIKNSDNPRTRTFHQTLITAGERGIRIDQRVDLFYFGCYSYLGEDRIIVHTLSTSGYRLLV